MARAGAAALALLALATAAGCGGGGVADGATVDVYVSAGLCAGASRVLDSAHGRAGDLEVRALCLRPATQGNRIDLAAQGSNARRATEDATAVAYLEASGKAAEFARPIVEEAEIAFVEAGSGEAAMKRVLRAVDDAGTAGSTRAKVREALE